MPTQDTSRFKRIPVPGKPGLYVRGKAYYYRARDDKGDRQWVACTRGGVNLGLKDSWQIVQQQGGTNEAEKLTPSTATFEQCAEKMLKVYRRKTSTKEAHVGIVRRLPSELKKKRMSEVTKADLKELVIQPMEEEGYSGSSIHNVLCTISLVFQYAMDKNYVSKNPVRELKVGTDKPSRKSKKKKRILNGDELAVILDCTSKPVHKVIFALMGLAGLRLSEALALSWEDVDFERGMISVRWQIDRYRDLVELKTEASEGEVEMGRSLQGILAAYNLEHAAGATTGRITTLDQRSTQRRLTTAATRAKVALPLPTPHDLRHSYASALMSLAADNGDLARVSRQLRHESVIITLAIYTHEWDRFRKAGQSAADVDATIGAKLL